MLVCNDALSVPCVVVNSSCFAGFCFLNSAHPLDVYNITPFVDSHVCDLRNNFWFPKRTEENIVGASPLSLCVYHFWWVTGRPPQRPKAYFEKNHFWRLCLVLYCVFGCFDCMCACVLHYPWKPEMGYQNSRNGVVVGWRGGAGNRILVLWKNT